MIKIKKMRKLAASNTGSVLVMSVVISMVILLLGTAYLQFVNQYKNRISCSISAFRAKGGSIAGLAEGLFNNSSGGSGFETSINNIEGTEVRYNYELYPEGSLQFGYSTTTNFTIIGRGYYKDPDFEDDFESGAAFSASSFNFADWLYITDKETQEYRPESQCTVKFWGSDTLDGKVHSNDLISFQTRDGVWPVFYAMVTSCSSYFSPVNAPDVVQFLGVPPPGYGLGASRINFPCQADSVRLHGYSYAGYPYFNGQLGNDGTGVTELTLQPTGFYVRHRPNSPSSRNLTFFNNFSEGSLTNELPLYPYPASKAIFIEGELWVTAAKGQYHYNQNGGYDSLMLGGFSGQLSIGASGDIIIPQDIIYVSSDLNGNIPEESMDVLGLISEKHILVWRNCAQSVTVQAALAAIGSLGVEDTLSAKACPNSSIPVDGIHGTISVDGINCYGVNNEKQQLIIKGCLIQRERGLIHTSYQGGQRGFISKKYKYDVRLQWNPPPHFFKTKGRANHYSPGRLNHIFGLYH